MKTYSLARLFLCIALAGCGGGDESTPQAPEMQSQQTYESVPSERMASVAQDLVSPAATPSPNNTAPPQPPSDAEAPRLLPQPASAVPLSRDLGLGPLTPTILRRAVAVRLESPTDLAAGPDGSLFFTERRSGLNVLRPEANPQQLISPKDLAGEDSAFFQAIALDPDFSRNHHVYVLSQTRKVGVESSKVIRLTVNPQATRVGDRKELLSAQQTTPSSATEGGRSGGALRFGPDGLLYVGLPDAGNPIAPQSGQSLFGKVLRIDRDGRPAPGSKVPANSDPRVYVSGVRDPTAFAFHAGSGALVMGERRGQRPDDLTLLKSAINLGWNPQCVGSKSSYCESTAEQVVLKETPVRPTIWSGQRVGDGLSALLRLDDPRWQSWRHAFVVAYDGAQRLDVVKINAAGEVVQASTALDKLGVGFKSVAAAPNGLYVLTRGKPGGEEIWQLFAH